MNEELGTLELWKLEIGVAVRPDYNKMRRKVIQFLFSDWFHGILLISRYIGGGTFVPP